MRVITLTPDDFARDCRRLEQACGPAPDLVVGIASGGVHVAGHIYPGVPHTAVECHRPSTAAKARHEWIFAIIRLLPRAVRDRLRIIEDERLRKRPPAALPEVDIPPQTPAARDILVVDDAVDSGTTMLAVVAALRRAVPAARIHTAAITVTTPDPLIRPDTALYTDTLIRFPWARDYR